ncbi:hypothetical protein C8A05DRAFT_19260 [Staphylotrichum tortipilum]|uniref:MYND-type domain-containing protein n=1 Tax=Staphylotrichum tortipilum TaxID=2831512 RepID=A0AAN6MCV2_9PEZI|nr:hypothetical protein C8A05DRAFT_19260 [Staphylotrichum longicolle]
MVSAPTTCARCGTEPTKNWRCSGCLDAPEYRPGDAAGVVYCGDDCQKGHWPAHKARCRSLGQRRKLLRAASLLKAALLTYREVMFDPELAKIEFQNGVLCLYQNLAPRSAYGLFPSHLTANVEHREAALANNQCTTAMALLAEAASTIQVIDLYIGKPLLRTRLIPNPNPVESTRVPHTVVKVRRQNSDETWIIDTADCQYGFRDVLVPYEKYLADRGCQLAGTTIPAPYDASETSDLDYFDTLPFMNTARSQREARELERQARQRFATYVATRVYRAILNGSQNDFQAASEGLAAGLKLYMLDFARMKSLCT